MNDWRVLNGIFRALRTAVAARLCSINLQVYQYRTIAPRPTEVFRTSCLSFGARRVEDRPEPYCRKRGLFCEWPLLVRRHSRDD